MCRTKILRASPFSRTGLDELMANVRKGRIDVVGVDKLDRLGRSFQQLAQLIS
jgi:DNA invertase Pin-like site-specific DNA recombinase